MTFKVRSLFTEALNPLTKITNGILKKLNYIESSLILNTKSYEEAKDLLQKTAAYHSNAFDELSPENQEIVTQKLWNTVKKILGPKPVEETSEDDLEIKIYNFLKTNSGIMFPLETSAKKLADAIRKPKE